MLVFCYFNISFLNLAFVLLHGVFDSSDFSISRKNYFLYNSITHLMKPFISLTRKCLSLFSVYQRFIATQNFVFLSPNYGLRKTLTNIIAISFLSARCPVMRYYKACNAVTPVPYSFFTGRMSGFPGQYAPLFAAPTKEE